MFDILIYLILTFAISTTTTEKVFSIMKIVKIKFRNKMDDEFLVDRLIDYMEKNIANLFTTMLIMDEFNWLVEAP